MTREELIDSFSALLCVDEETKFVLMINSAIAYFNWFTFQNYSLNDLNSIPHDVFMVIIELVKNKYHEKIWIESERLSDYSVTYSTKDLTDECRILLNRYRIIYVE